MVTNAKTNDLCCAPTRATVTRTMSAVPAVDIAESSEAFVLRINVPGASAEDVNVSFERGVLTVEAAGRGPSPDEGRYLLRERRSGALRRSFRLGDGIDTERIKANVEAGVLTVELPKAASAKPRRIDVKAG